MTRIEGNFDFVFFEMQIVSEHYSNIRILVNAAHNVIRAEVGK